MSHLQPHSAIVEQLSADYALLAPNVTAWHFDIDSGALLFSKEFPLVFLGNENPFQQLSALMAALTPPDQSIFLQTFNSDPLDNDPRVRICDVKCANHLGECRVRFIGRLTMSAQHNSRQYEGVAVPSTHWLVDPGTETNYSLERTLFAENPIASFMTDEKGVLLQVNSAFEKLFEVSSRKVSAAIGRYNIFYDKKLQSMTDVAALLAKVYHAAESASLDLVYPLRAVPQSSQPKKISLRVSLLPLRNRHGVLERVLIQLQDLSREKNMLQVLLKQQHALLESESSYKAFIANSSEAIWCYEMAPPIALSSSFDRLAELIAERACLSRGNNMLVAMLGANSLHDIVGMKLHDNGLMDYMLYVQLFVHNKFQMVDHDVVREDAKGRRFYFQISCVGVISNNSLTRVWGTTKDVTMRKRYEHRLEYISLHDGLTGLPNRANLYQEIERFYAQKSAALGALLFIDLDRFKEINDTLGHQVGDRLLQLIGPRIASELTDINGTVARMGGDEFAVFLPNIRNQQHAVVFAHCILDALQLEFDLDVFCAEISASIGIVLAPTQAADVNELIRFADVAMYYAKKQMLGVAVYSPEIDPHSPKRLAMMSELGRAIREDQLYLCYQPKIKLASKSFYGFEALLRWNHPELGLVPPNEFIPIVEMTSLIYPLAAWVLEKSIAQCCVWHSQGLMVSVAVNLSARNLLDENMPKLVRSLLKKYNLPANFLELEITESTIMNDPSRAMRVLQQLHELGTQLSIDDFGAGYSSLTYLKKLPVQALKIDCSFIRNMLEDKQDELIVESTIHLAHSLSLKVVAEGVENAALIERLSRMGCDEAQGYYIGPPMPLTQIEQWIKASHWTEAR